MILQQLPNTISVARMLLIGPVVWCLLTGRAGAALWLFALAGLSDAADGYFARRFGWKSRAGALLDPAADKLLLVASFVTLGWIGLAPWGLVATVFARDLLIIGLYLQRAGPVRGQPTELSKLNTVAQILCVLLLVYAAAHGAEPVLVETMLAITLMTTVFSGLHYLWLWARG